MNKLTLFTLFIAIFANHLYAQNNLGFLESPQQNSVESGIGIIRGWVCDANEIAIQIDSTAKQVAGYGTSRKDTKSTCGDSNNGFGLTTNWNLFGSGTHTLKMFVDGNLFNQVTFTTADFGSEFLRDKSAAYIIAAFPEAGNAKMITWSEPQQNFVFTRGGGSGGKGTSGDATHQLESPQTQSTESGIGLIRGWVCEAQKIELQIDTSERFDAAYGTERADTLSLCNDTNNGFGVTTNWGIFGNGEHTIKAFADNVLFAEVKFVVTSIGTEFLRGQSHQQILNNFPEKGNNTTVQWSELQQNFIIIATDN